VSSGDLSLTGAAGANAAALEELFRLRYGAFLRVAVAITGSSDVGRDAVQEGLARALAGRASFRGSGSLEAWLWRTVVNTARNISARSPAIAEASDLAASATAPDDERRAEVRAAVRRLPERQRLVLFLRYYADLDYASIGIVLGIRRGTVSATLNQAHSAMRRLLDEEGTA
jgi:RNA polymerase sigma factor (sigma-70 family)